MIPVIVALGGGVTVAGVWYYASPKNTDVGYRPHQPVDYSHKLHAGDLGIDCRYCHVKVETSPVAGVPPTQVCMNCHTLVGVDNVKLDKVRESWQTGEAIEWVRIHKLPDYSFFDHSLHLRAGVGCASCHGRVDQMEVVWQREPLSMGWCLDCHRNPEQHLRPPDQLTNMAWKPDDDQDERSEKIMKHLKLVPPEDCTACHR